MKYIEGGAADLSTYNVYELSTGRRFSANNGILGIDPTGQSISEGYDGSLDHEAKAFTPNERREVALFAIVRWMRWAEEEAA